jgi:hypothetical protein
MENPSLSLCLDQSPNNELKDKKVACTASLAFGVRFETMKWFERTAQGL